MSFAIRCATPDCDWGKKMPDLSGDQLELRYSEFRKHCVQRHKLEEWDTNAYMRLDLRVWTLTLVEWPRLAGDETKLPVTRQTGLLTLAIHSVCYWA